MATSGDYSDLNNKPKFKTFNGESILGEGDVADNLAEVAKTGDYNDLKNKPEFKTINNESILGDGNIDIQGGGKEDKKYDPINFSGLGKVYLKQNIVEEGGVKQNRLVQDAFYKDDGEGNRVPNTNTVFVVQYGFDLNGETIEIPEGCVLEFDGGSISNGTLEGNDTFIDNKYVSTKILRSVNLEGNWKRNIVANGDRIDYAQNRFRTLAHRGYPYSTHNRFAQDNSLAAIDEAGLQGFTGIECDPRRDVNGVIVLLHDADVRSVSNYVSATPDDPNSYLIENLDYRTVFYKDKFGLGTNRRITTLAEAVAVCKAYNMFMFFDSKGLDGKGRSVSIGDLEEIMDKMDYHNWGVFNYGEDYMSTKSDYIVKGIQPKTTVEALRESAAKFSYLPNLWMRKYSTAKDNVPIEVLRECKKLGIKVIVNYIEEPGTEIDMNDDYISEAYQYYDFFLGDDHIMSGRRTSVGETESGVIKCINGNLPVPRLLQDEAVTVEGVTTYPYKDGLASFTYKDSLWAINHYSVANPRLVTGYIMASAVPLKLPELASKFPGGAAVLSTLMYPYRSISAYISGSIDIPRIVIQNLYNNASGNSELVSTYELVHDKNASSLLEIFEENYISHSGDIPSIGTDYEAGEWRQVGGSSDASVIDTNIEGINGITKGINLSGDLDTKGCGYEITNFKYGVYTFSFYIKGTGNVRVSLTNSTNTFEYPIEFAYSEDYIRKSVIIDISENMLYEGNKLILRILTTGTTTNVDMCGFMLQRGRMLTQWIPKSTDYSELDNNIENFIKYSDVPSLGQNYAKGNWREIGGRTNGLSTPNVDIKAIPEIRKELKIDSQTQYVEGVSLGFAYEIQNFTPGKYVLSFYTKCSGDWNVALDNEGTRVFIKAISASTEYKKVSVKLDISEEDLFEGRLLVLQMYTTANNNQVEICGMRLHEGFADLPWAPSTSDYPISGATANRPPEPKVGYMYFDTTIGKPIYWNGTSWVDATGTVV